VLLALFELLGTHGLGLLGTHGLGVPLLTSLVILEGQRSNSFF